MDSVSMLETADRGQIVVTGSNGGLASGRVASAFGVRFAVFSDAGIGTDRAGVLGLEYLDQVRIPAVAVSHDSAEISDGMDIWSNGIITVANQTAAALSIRSGTSVPEAVATFVATIARLDERG
ncbi:hypothetical protein [Nocardia sp. NPDC049707]|uniref:hypothetical protein n=1 Tax=Nocardia sp. NPDC049707 TaxID=3154735 RepID=UPI003448D3A1